MSKPAEILLLSDHPERIQRWARVLTGPGTSLWQGASALQPQILLDVIVTDRDFTTDWLPIPGSSARLVAGEIGVVSVGHEGTVSVHASATRPTVEGATGAVHIGPGSADVSLPEQCTPGELRLACSLLKELVRLRRHSNRQRRVQRVLTQLAMNDALTGLPNRRSWEDRLAACELVRQAGPGELGVAVIDLDNFKAINTHGHLTGDRVLQLVGRRLGDAMGENLFVARLGGDEFGVVITGLDPAATTAAVEQLRIAACADCDPPVTASAGVASGGAGIAGGAEDLLQAADQALRRAKAAGRNRTLAAPTAHGICDSHTSG